MKEPRFSVIIPALNEEKFLPKLLASLAAQTTRDFEVIVVDGKSRDKTVEVAKSFGKKLPSLRVLTSPRSNLPMQRNLGATEAKGEWLVFVDADSVVLPYFIERLAAYITNGKPKLVTTWFQPDSEVIGDAIFTLLINMFLESAILFRRPIAPGPLTIVHRDTYTLVGGYDESVRWGEDYDFTSRLAKRGVQLQMLRETLCIYSLRRFRNQGKLWFVQAYAKASLAVLFTKKPPNDMPNYVMGGHLYGKRKHSRSVLKRLEKTAKKLMKELFE